MFNSRPYWHSTAFLLASALAGATLGNFAAAAAMFALGAPAFPSAWIAALVFLSVYSFSLGLWLVKNEAHHGR